MEKLFLRGLFFREELHVVDYEYVYVPVFIAEIHTPLGVRLALTDSRDKVVGELFASRVKHVFKRVVLLDMIRDRVHDMRFSETRAAVNKQRVITLARVFGNRFRRRVEIPVRRAYDERIESVFRVEGGVVEFVLSLRYSLALEVVRVSALDVKFNVVNARIRCGKGVSYLVEQPFRHFRGEQFRLCRKHEFSAYYVDRL